MREEITSSSPLYTSGRVTHGAFLSRLRSDNFTASPFHIAAAHCHSVQNTLPYLTLPPVEIMPDYISDVARRLID